MATSGSQGHTTRGGQNAYHGGAVMPTSGMQERTFFPVIFNIDTCGSNSAGQASGNPSGLWRRLLPAAFALECADGTLALAVRGDVSL